MYEESLALSSPPLREAREEARRASAVTEGASRAGGFMGQRGGGRDHDLNAGGGGDAPSVTARARRATSPAAQGR